MIFQTVIGMGGELGDEQGVLSGGNGGCGTGGMTGGKGTGGTPLGEIPLHAAHTDGKPRRHCGLAHPFGFHRLHDPLA